MKIGGYETNIKKEILSVDKKIYPGMRKRLAVSYTYNDNGHIRPMWKDFDNTLTALEYINAIEKLIKT